MQANDSFRLVVRRGPQPNQIFELKQDRITLGRDIKNDIVINDPEVSREHLNIVRTANGYTIEDKGSTNGTFIRGERISTPRALNDGDLVGLGETVTLQFERVRAAPAYGEQPSPYAQPQQPQQPQQQSPYAPPAQPQQPAQPAYNQPAYGQQQYGTQQPAEPAPSSGYGQAGGYSQPQAGGYDASQQAGYGGGYYSPQAPMTPGLDHDPAAVREEESRNTLRWVGIGCGTLSVVCCCSSMIGLVIIDTLNLWNSVPWLANLLRPIANIFF